MALIVLATSFLVAAGTTAALIPPLGKLAWQQNWIDKPDGGRKLHKRPVPTVGGIAIAFGFFVGVTFVYLVQSGYSFDVRSPSIALCLGAIAMVVVGLVDDARGLGFKQKFLAQLIVAFILIQAGYRLDVSALDWFDGDSYLGVFYSSVLTVVWIVGTINAVNLLDGLDGLAAGVSVIGFATVAIIFGIGGTAGLLVPAVAISGALVAFLFFNFSPASIFMGDSGSLLLGVLLAAYTLEAPMHADPLLAVLIPAVALGLPIVDTNLSIVRRLLNRQAIFAPDRDHIHHRLLMHFSPREAVLIMYAVAATFGVVAILMSLSGPVGAYLLLAGTVVAICAGILAMGYIDARPLLYNIHPKLGSAYVDLFSADMDKRMTPADSGPIRGSETNVGTMRKRYIPVSSGDGVHSRSPEVRPSPVHFNANTDTMHAIAQDSMIALSDGLTHADLGDESVVLNVDTGIYFGLNDVGSVIVQYLDEPKRVSDLLEWMNQEFDVDRDQLWSDMHDFLEQMHEAKLIKVINETAA